MQCHFRTLHVFYIFFTYLSVSQKMRKYAFGYKCSTPF